MERDPRVHRLGGGDRGADTAPATSGGRPGHRAGSGLLRRPGLARRDRVGAASMRRLIRDISSVLIISGLLLVVDAGATLVWQEPVTAVVAMIKRSQIDTRFLSFKSAPLSRLDQHALGSLRS